MFLQILHDLLKVLILDLKATGHEYGFFFPEDSAVVCTYDVPQSLFLVYIKAFLHQLSLSIVNDNLAF
jgi:hypothetical protein